MQKLTRLAELVAISSCFLQDLYDIYGHSYERLHIADTFMQPEMTS